MTEQERVRHDQLYEEGCRLAKGHILVGDYGVPPPLGWFARRGLERAIRRLRAALELAPDNWSALWMTGKIHQRLDRQPEALECLARAFDLNPSHPAIAREAGIIACDLGDAPSAVRFCRAAVQNEPSDGGLLSNLALALLISGDFAAAQSTVNAALARSPDDATIRTVHQLVGRWAQMGLQPRSTRDLFRR